MAFWDITGVTTGETVDGETEIFVTSDFRGNHIMAGNGFQFPGEAEYQITRIDERSGKFYITPEYTGAAKSNTTAWVKIYFSGAAPAQQQLAEAQTFFQQAMSPDPLDLTPGRVLRVGDFGWNDQTIILNSEHNLNNIVTPGEYGWFGSSIPANAPKTSGSHTMHVYGGVGRSYRQTVWRSSTSEASAFTYFRNVFSAIGDGTGIGEGNDAVEVSPWMINFDSANVIGPVTMSNGTPSGGLTEIETGLIVNGISYADQAAVDAGPDTLYENIGDMWWRYTRRFDGTLIAEIEVVIDCADTSQVFNWPINFVSGGKVFLAGMAYADSSPNAALLTSNDVHIVPYNGTFSVGLGTAGTMPATPTADERLRLVFLGRWTD